MTHKHQNEIIGFETVVMQGDLDFGNLGVNFFISCKDCRERLSIFSIIEVEYLRLGKKMEKDEYAKLLKKVLIKKGFLL